MIFVGFSMCAGERVVRDGWKGGVGWCWVRWAHLRRCVCTHTRARTHTTRAHTHADVPARADTDSHMKCVSLPPSLPPFRTCMRAGVKTTHYSHSILNTQAWLTGARAQRQQLYVRYERRAKRKVMGSGGASSLSHAHTHRHAHMQACGARALSLSLFLSLSLPPSLPPSSSLCLSLTTTASRLRREAICCCQRQDAGHHLDAVGR